MSARHPALAGLITFAIAVVPALLWVAVDWRVRPAGIVRIGVNNSPPYSVVSADGSLSGFSVEVLREAARRRGIRLQWIVCPESADTALRAGKVDIWHLYTDFPERHQFAYFTDPWLCLKYTLVVRDTSTIRSLEDTKGRRVSHFPGPTEVRLVPRLFPLSTIVRTDPGRELEPICTGEADAALIEIKSTVARLLKGPLSCGAVAMRLIPINDASYQMAIGANRSGLAEARILRAEISNMAQDRTLDRLHQKWFQFTSDETRIVNELSESQQRSRLFLWGAASLAVVIVLLVVLIRREQLSRRFTAAVIDGAGGLIVICDAAGRIVRFNRAFQVVLTKKSHEIRGKLIWEVLVPPHERLDAQSRFAQLAAGGEHVTVDHWHAPDGNGLFSWSNTVLLNRSGHVAHIIGTGTDISLHEAVEEKLGYEAAHDPLTGTMNRRQFLRELEAAMAEAQRRGDPLYLAFADFDHFKLINDTYGHEAGDEVLVCFAKILRQELLPVDRAGRLGGDEFCLLIRNTDPEGTLLRIARRLRTEEFRAANGRIFHAGVTIGIASYCQTMDQPSDFLRVADRALYEAKRRLHAAECQMTI